MKMKNFLFFNGVGIPFALYDDSETNALSLGGSIKPLTLFKEVV